jgi:uncharacterized protein
VPRQRCCGLIENLPMCSRFSPEGEPDSGSVLITIEELEALRLKDLEGLDQIECAQKMGLTRPTLQRILRSARLKTAKALTEGLTIVIEGGNFIMKNRVFECVACHHVWEEAPCSEGGKHGFEIACPKCGGMQKMKLQDGVKHACGGGQGHGDGHGCCGNK